MCGRRLDKKKNEISKDKMVLMELWNRLLKNNNKKTQKKYI